VNLKSLDGLAGISEQNFCGSGQFSLRLTLFRASFQTTAQAFALRKSLLEANGTKWSEAPVLLKLLP